MEKEEIKEQRTPNDTQALYREVPEKIDLTYRDDLHGFDELRDALKRRRRRGGRFRLVDSGVFDGSQLEKLVSAGADLYTSDRVRKDILELEFILKAAGNGGAVMAYLFHEELQAEAESGSLTLSSLSHLGKEGLIVHISNREKERNFFVLSFMATQCRQGSGRLVYYHHGPIPPEFVSLGKEGVWIHVSDRNFSSEEDLPVLLDSISAAQSAGSNIVLHVEKGMAFSFLHDIFQSGAVVLFKTAPQDFKSPLRPLEDEARRTKLDFRSFYLYSNFLL
ncbi:MAG: hypothetical protein PVF22_01840 [Candidatus Aminicenantes bacterium]